MGKSLSKKRLFAPLLALLLAGMWLSGSANAGFYLREEARPMWVKADTNRDGYLSRPEVYAEDPQLLAGFDKADINRDGKLDLGEFEILLISL